MEARQVDFSLQDGDVPPSSYFAQEMQLCLLLDGPQRGPGTGPLHKGEARP